MPEAKTPPEDALRPTKKQKELLSFIEAFIAEHGYSPSYREIMRSCNYTSVATVALHVNNLIKRGHLQKREHAARSLEVVQAPKTQPLATNQIKAGDEKWLVDKIDYFFAQAEQSKALEATDIDKLYVLVGCLKVLGLEGAAQSFVPRLTLLKKRYTKS
jgi:SOS-response transcriptional repressor LexA